MHITRLLLVIAIIACGTVNKYARIDGDSFGFYLSGVICMVLMLGLAASVANPFQRFVAYLEQEDEIEYDSQPVRTVAVMPTGKPRHALVTDYRSQPRHALASR